jgi:hypothetical protein
MHPAQHRAHAAARRTCAALANDGARSARQALIAVARYLTQIDRVRSPAMSEEGGGPFGHIVEPHNTYWTAQQYEVLHPRRHDDGQLFGRLRS